MLVTQAATTKKKPRKSNKQKALPGGHPVGRGVEEDYGGEDVS